MTITQEDKNLIVNHYSAINSKFTSELFDSFALPYQKLILKEFREVACKSKQIKKDMIDSPSLFDGFFYLVLNGLLAFDKLAINVLIKYKKTFTREGWNRLTDKQKQIVNDFVSK